jgi:hypothetical protein
MLFWRKTMNTQILHSSHHFHNVHLPISKKTREVLKITGAIFFLYLVLAFSTPILARILVEATSLIG